MQKEIFGKTEIFLKFKNNWPKGHLGSAVPLRKPISLEPGCKYHLPVGLLLFTCTWTGPVEHHWIWMKLEYLTKNQTAVFLFSNWMSSVLHMIPNIVQKMTRGDICDIHTPARAHGGAFPCSHSVNVITSKEGSMNIRFLPSWITDLALGLSTLIAFKMAKGSMAL